jgi:hypothetical protein
LGNAKEVSYLIITFQVLLLTSLIIALIQYLPSFHFEPYLDFGIINKPIHSDSRSYPICFSTNSFPRLAYSHSPCLPSSFPLTHHQSKRKPNDPSKQHKRDPLHLVRQPAHTPHFTSTIQPQSCPSNSVHFLTDKVCSSKSSLSYHHFPSQKTRHSDSAPLK